MTREGFLVLISWIVMIAAIAVIVFSYVDAVAAENKTLEAINECMTIVWGDGWEHGWNVDKMAYCDGLINETNTDD